MSIDLINRDFQQQIDSSIQKLLDDIADFEFITPNGLLFKMSDINKKVPVYLDNEKIRIEESDMTWEELIKTIDRMEHEKAFLEHKKNRTHEESNRYEYLFVPIRQLKEARNNHLNHNPHPSPSDRITIKSETILRGYYTHKGKNHCPEIVLLMETLGNNRYNARSVATTLVHEMFHAFYDYDLRQNDKNLPFVEEPLTEYAMLKFVEALAKKDEKYEDMFRSAKNDVLRKKYSLGITHYGFGYCLWECEDKLGKTLENIHWIEVFHDAKYKISDSTPEYNEYARPFRQGLYPFRNEQYQMELLRVVLLNALLYTNSVQLPLPGNGSMSVTWEECVPGSYWALDGNTLYFDGDFSEQAFQYLLHDIEHKLFSHHSHKISSWEDLYHLNNITQIVLWDHFICDDFYHINDLFSSLSSKNNDIVRLSVSPRNLHLVEIDGSIYDASKTTLFYCLYLATQIDIPETVKMIGRKAFHNCKSLRHVKIPNGIEEIPDGVFYYCESLEDEVVVNHKLLCIPRTVTKFEVPDNVIEICSGAFAHCNKLQHLTIPPGIEEISAVFGDCEVLEDEVIFKHKLLCVPKTATEYVIANDVEEIDWWAFYHCLSLKHVTILSGIKKISSFAFCACKNLESVTIEGGVEEIGIFAFGGCALKEAILPASLNKIHIGAFSECPMQTLTFKGITPPEVREPFDSKHLQQGCTIHVPAGSIDNYKKVFPDYTIVEY